MVADIFLKYIVGSRQRLQSFLFHTTKMRVYWQARVNQYYFTPASDFCHTILPLTCYRNFVVFFIDNSFLSHYYVIF
jgi:hypothetical protein